VRPAMGVIGVWRIAAGSVLVLDRRLSGNYLEEVERPGCRGNPPPNESCPLAPRILFRRLVSATVLWPSVATGYPNTRCCESHLRS
jgi:hypothetical protein